MTDPLTEIEGTNAQHNLAVLTAAYYNGLRRQGLPRHAALHLTAVWLTTCLHLNSQQGGGDA